MSKKINKENVLRLSEEKIESGKKFAVIVTGSTSKESFIRFRNRFVNAARTKNFFFTSRGVTIYNYENGRFTYVGQNRDNHHVEILKLKAEVRHYKIAVALCIAGLLVLIKYLYF